MSYFEFCIFTHTFHHAYPYPSQVCVILLLFPTPALIRHSKSTKHGTHGCSEPQNPIRYACTPCVNRE